MIWQLFQSIKKFGTLLPHFILIVLLEWMVSQDTFWACWSIFFDDVLAMVQGFFLRDYLLEKHPLF